MLNTFIDGLKARGIGARDVTVQVDGRKAWRESLGPVGKFSELHIFELVPVSIKFRVKKTAGWGGNDLLQHYKQLADFKAQLEGQWEGLKLAGGCMPDEAIAKDELRVFFGAFLSNYREITGKTALDGEIRYTRREPAWFGPMATEHMILNLDVLLKHIGLGEKTTTGDELKEAYYDALSYINLTEDVCSFERFCELYPWFQEDKEKHPAFAAFGAYFFWLEGSKEKLQPVNRSDDEGAIYMKEMVTSFIQKNAEKAVKNKEKVLDQMMKKCVIHPRARHLALEMLERSIETAQST